MDTASTNIGFEATKMPHFLNISSKNFSRRRPRFKSETAIVSGSKVAIVEPCAILPFEGDEGGEERNAGEKSSIENPKNSLI